MLPRPSSLSTQIRPPWSSTNRFESARPEAGPLALPDPRLALLELLEDPLPILGSDARAGVGDRDPDLAVDSRRAHVDLPAGRRELHRVREQVEDDLLDPSLVAVDHVDLRIGGERDTDPVLRRALAHHHDAALERLPKGERVHLELDLSRLDLGEVEDVVDQREQMVPRRDDVVEVLRLLLVHRADHLVAQHLREADDRVQRRPQLVRHVGQELRLVPARRLELRVEAPELVVHPVDVGGQRAQLVSVVDLDVAREVARRDRGQASVDPLDRSDQRPREDEPQQQREDDRSRRDADEQGPGARERARVPGDQIVDLCSRPVRELGASWLRSLASCSASLGAGASRRRVLRPRSWSGLVERDDLCP